MFNRDFSSHGIAFTIANYRPRNNEFERGLKYQLLIRIQDGPRDCDFIYRSTSYKFESLKAAKQFAINNYSMWL